MSSMLEQAIVDAQALREAALKNAEQALIEKFAPQIKEAVESLLEKDDKAMPKKKVAYEGKAYSLMEIENGKATIVREGEKPFVVSESELSELSEELLQEEEVEAGKSPEDTEEKMLDPFEDLPYAFQDSDSEVEYTLDMEEMENEILDFGSIVDYDAEEEPQQSYDDAAGDVGAEGGAEPAAEPAGGGDVLAGLGLQENLEENDDLVQEIIDLMNEMDESEIIEEELIVDTSEQKDGTFQTNQAILQYQKDLEAARKESSDLEEELEEEKKENEKLQETIKKFKHRNKQYKDVVEKLSKKVNETLLSNAKLLYSNKTLSDASLNERQKTKIVEAIAKARTPEEAKNLCETLNATVTSGSNTKAPRTLSESVQRKSNLSGILPRRKQVDQDNQHAFAEHMKKLAGIK